MEYTIAKILRFLLVFKEDDSALYENDSNEDNEYGVDDMFISIGIIVICIVFCALIFLRLM